MQDFYCVLSVLAVNNKSYVYFRSSLGYHLYIYLVFSPIFVAEPQIFEYNGASLEFNVFPELAEKGLLNGHLSSEKEIHIHSKKDIENLR